MGEVVSFPGWGGPSYFSPTYSRVLLRGRSRRVGGTPWDPSVSVHRSYQIVLETSLLTGFHDVTSRLLRSSPLMNSV